MFTRPSCRRSGDRGSDGGLREDSETGSAVSAEEGGVGRGRPAANGGTKMSQKITFVCFCSRCLNTCDVFRNRRRTSCPLDRLSVTPLAGKTLLSAVKRRLLRVWRLKEISV